MTISIEPTDFGQDILDSVTPILGALGLLNDQNKLDIDGWSLEKALGVFGTYERTDFILNLLSGYLASPSYVYRENLTGLIVEKGELSPSEVREEEWFPISKTDDWSVNLTVYHQKLDDNSFETSLPPLPNPSNPHSIELGLGIKINDLAIADLVLDSTIAIPIVEIRNKSLSPGTEYLIQDGIPELVVNRLIWEDDGNPLARVALSGVLRPMSGLLEVGPMSATGIALRTAFGKEDGDGNSGFVANFSLLDFIAKAGDFPSNLEIDLVNIASGNIGGVLDQIVPALIDMIPDGAGYFAEHLLPLLGLIDSDWSSWSGTPGEEPEWPRLDLLSLIDDLPNFQLIWTKIQSHLLSLATPEIATQWLTHLSKLIFFGNPWAPVILGNCTKESPISLKLVDSPSVDVTLLIRMWDDVDGTTYLDVGVRAFVNENINSQVDIEGGTTIWLVSVPVSGSGSVRFVPELILDVLFSGDSNQSLIDVQADDDGTPLANLQVEIKKARLGVQLSRDGTIEPVVELIEVDIGAHPDDQHYPVIDLTSGSSVMQAIEGALQGILNTVSDSLALHPVIQWAGSLLGLVAPRGYPFRRVDYEFENDKEYALGELLFYETRVYEVTEAGISPQSGGEPTHVGETEAVIGTGSLKLLHRGDNQPIWETNDGQDKRINLMDLIQNPIQTIMNYHHSLLEDNSFDYEGEIRTAWIYVFEALGNLVNTGLAPLMKLQPPVMITNTETTVTGNGDENSPWRISIGDDGELPDFSLSAYPMQNGANEIERINIGLASTITILQIVKESQLHLEARCSTVLFSVPLIESHHIQIPVLLPNLRADLFLHDAFGNSQIQLLQMPGMMITLEGLRTSLEWRRADSLGWLFSIESPRIGSIAPDLPHLGTQVSHEFLNQFQWLKGRLLLPDGSMIRPDLETFTNQGDNPSDNTFTFVETNEVVTIKWDFFGLACESMGFNTWSGLFGIIDTDPNENSFIDLEPNQSIIENEGVRMISGQLLALKGGSLGFLLSTFFRINPHMIYYDLGNHLDQNLFYYNIESDGPSNWPSNWAAYHPRGRGVFGLGPFSLPYDWPTVNWSNLLLDPTNEIKSHITRIFSGVSQSGEPFAIAGLRWVEGLFKKSIPDLSSSSLGWQTEKTNGLPTVILPEVSDEVAGDGTYGNPWKAGLSTQKNSAVDLLIWLDPDGPNTSNQIENVLTSNDLAILKQLESDSTDFMSIVQQTPDDWSGRVAKLLNRLGNFSPRIKHAIGDVSEHQLAEDLFEVDQFLKLGDGFSSYLNQIASNSRKVESIQNKQYLGSYTSGLQNQKVVGELFDFIIDFTSEDWNPEVSGSNNITVIFLHNISDFKFSDGNGVQSMRPTYKLSESLGDVYGFDPYSIHEINWDNLLSVDIGLFSNYLPAIANKGILDVRLSSRFNHNTTLIGGLAEQIRLTIESVISLTGGKVALIAHGIVGNALQKLVEESVLDENKVSGIINVNTPNEIDTLQLLQNEKLRRGFHLLSLIENQELDLAELLTTNGLTRKQYLSRAELLHTVRAVSETIIQHTKEV